MSTTIVPPPTRTELIEDIRAYDDAAHAAELELLQLSATDPTRAIVERKKATYRMLAERARGRLKQIESGP